MEVFACHRKQKWWVAKKHWASQLTRPESQNLVTSSAKVGERSGKWTRQSTCRDLCPWASTGVLQTLMFNGPLLKFLTFIPCLSLMISFILIVNKQSQTRFSKYSHPCTIQHQQRSDFELGLSRECIQRESQQVSEGYIQHQEVESKKSSLMPFMEPVELYIRLPRSRNRWEYGG
jgi:hypothetical protein